MRGQTPATLRANATRNVSNHDDVGSGELSLSCNESKSVDEETSTVDRRWRRFRPTSTTHVLLALEPPRAIRIGADGVTDEEEVVDRKRKFLVAERGLGEKQNSDAT
jgi:hypothetical protein